MFHQNVSGTGRIQIVSAEQTRFVFFSSSPGVSVVCVCVFVRNQACISLCSQMASKQALSTGAQSFTNSEQIKSLTHLTSSCRTVQFLQNGNSILMIQ